jgi:hypothetical protein
MEYNQDLSEEWLVFRWMEAAKNYNTIRRRYHLCGLPGRAWMGREYAEGKEAERGGCPI